MPYIDKKDRELFDERAYEPETAGELNYCITNLCVEFLPKTPSYEDYNTIIGALECAKQEFYRRAVVPYEETKIIKNGDVY